MNRDFRRNFTSRKGSIAGMRLMKLGEIHLKDRSWGWKELSDCYKHLFRVKFKHTLTGAKLIKKILEALKSFLL